MKIENVPEICEENRTESRNRMDSNGILKRNFGYVNDFREDSQNSQMNCKNYVGKNFGAHEKDSNLRNISEDWEDFQDLREAVMPAGCGQDFEGSLSPQSPAIAEIDLEKSGCRWLQSTDDCTGIRMGNDVLHFGSEKVPMTPTMPTTQWEDPDQECPLTKTSLHRSHNTFLAV